MTDNNTKTQAPGNGGDVWTMEKISEYTQRIETLTKSKKWIEALPRNSHTIDEIAYIEKKIDGFQKLINRVMGVSQ